MGVTYTVTANPTGPNEFDNLADAVTAAQGNAQSGDTIILDPSYQPLSNVTQNITESGLTIAGNAALPDSMSITLRVINSDTTPFALNLTGVTPFRQLINTAGNHGGNTITGSDGGDTLTGAAGNDILTGGSGNDSIIGRGGNDIIDGGDGIDMVTLTINNFNGGTNTIDLTQPISYYNNGQASIKGIEQLFLIGSYVGNQTFITRADLNVFDEINGGPGSDTILIGQGGDGSQRVNDEVSGLIAHNGPSAPSTDIDTLIGDYSRMTVGVGVAVDDGQGHIIAAPDSGLTDSSLGNDGWVSLASDPTLTLGEFDHFDVYDFTGGSGADHLVGGGMNDTFTGNAGNDTFAGAGGNDTVDYSRERTAAQVAQVGNVIVNLSTVDHTVGSHTVASNTAIDNFGDTDTLISIENVTTGGGNDTVFGSAGANIIQGGGGDDVLDGGAGIDTAVFSGAKADYTVTPISTTTFQIHDTRGGSPDGTDTISNFEFVKFSDQTVAVNTAPVFSNLNAATSGTERVGTNLDTDTTVADAELAALNGSSGDYMGSSLTIHRSGGALTEDTFGFSPGGASFTVAGNALQSGGQTFATFTNANGVMTVSFDSSQTTATSALVNNVIEHVTYADEGGAPAPSVSLDYTFNDGQTTALGGARETTQSLVVNVAPVDGAPGITAPAAETGAEDMDLAITGLSVSDADAGSATLTVTLSVLHGTVTLASGIGGGLQAAAISGNGTNTVTVTGSQSVIDATLASANGVLYRSAIDFNGPDTLTLHTDDHGNSGQTTINLLQNPGAEVGILGGASGQWVSVAGAITVQEYGSNFGGLAVSDSAAIGGGDAYFTGGSSDAVSTAQQVFDVSAYAARIDIGAVSGVLSGYFGGNQSQNDNATLTVHYLDASHAEIGAHTIGGFNAADRGGTTELLMDSNTAGVPVGTRFIEVDLTATRTDPSYNDGYADNLSLSLNLDASRSQAAVAITVSEVNDSPIATGETLTAVDEDSGARTISFASLLVNDVAGPATATDEISSQHLTISAVNHAIGGTVSISGTDVIFTPAANYNGPASFDYTVTDDGTTGGAPDPKSATATASFTINSVNDAPSGADKTVTILEDHGRAFVLSDFPITDPNDNPANAFAGIVVSTLPTGGTLTLTGGPNGGVVALNDFISASEINLGHLIFTPAQDLNGIGAASFTFQVRDDGGVNAGGVNLDPTSHTFSFDITALNDAPIATGNTESLTGIIEDATSPSGATVSSLFASHFSDSVDNVAGGSSPNGFAGVAVTATAAATTGAWQYFDGSQWQDITGVSGNHALTLDASTLVRFLPALDFNGAAPGLTVHLVDDSVGALTTGGFANLGTVGGTTAYSQDTVVLGETVTAVNDAATVVGTSASLTAINEDTLSPAGQPVSDVVQANFSDARDDVVGGSTHNALAGVAITGNAATTEGTWQYFNGSIWVGISGVTEGHALVLSASTDIRFLPAQDFNGAAPALTAHLIDSTATPTTGDTVDLTAGGATGGSSAYSSGTLQITETINAVNDAPTASAPATYNATEQTDLQLKGTGLSVGDVDGGNGLESVTLSVTEGILTVNAGGTSVVVDHNATGAVTLTGTVADINALLSTDLTSSVIYRDTLDAPSATATLTLSIDDNGNTGSGVQSPVSATSTISIAAVNDSPMLDLDGTDASGATGANYKASYLLGNSPVPIAGGNVVITDPDGTTTLASATITLTNHNVSDVLAFVGTPPGDIVASAYNASTGEMTLTSAGGTTLAQWQAALHQIEYSNTDLSPDTTTRNITIQLDDGAASNHLSAIAHTTIFYNQPPVVSNLDGDSVSFTEDGAPVALDQGTAVSIADSDSTNFDTGTLTASITANGISGEDALVILSTAHVQVAGGTHVLVDSIEIGTVTSNGLAGADLAVTFNGNANAANVAVLVDAIGYTNTNHGNPSTAARTISITVSDGDGGTSDPANVTVTISPQNDAPTVTTSGGTTGSSESAAAAIDGGLTVGDVDNAMLASATVSITGGFHSAEDILAFANDNATMGNIGASYNLGTGILTLTSSAATATLAEWQAALRAVTYEDTSDAPNTVDRTISFIVNDGSFDSAVATKAVSITALDDAPTASNLTQILTLAEDAGTAPKLFTAAPVVGDVDSASVTATLTLTNTAAGVLNGAGTGVGGVYTVTGTPAAVSAALAAVTFAPAADFNGSASVTVAIDDGQAPDQGSNPSGTVSITVTEVNDAPVAASDTLSSVAEDSGQRTISGATLTGNDHPGPATATDESTQTLTVTAATNAVGGTVSVSSGNVLFTPDHDFNGTAGFDYTVTDNGTTNGGASPQSATAHVTFAVTALDDAPTASNLTQTLTLAEDAGTAPKLFTAAPVVGDVDSASVTATLTLTNTAAGVLNGAGTGVGGVYTVTGTPAAVSAALAAVTFAPAADFNGSASVTVAIDDGQAPDQGSNPSGTVSITVTEVNDAPVAASDTLSSVAEDSGQRTISGATLTGNDHPGPATATDEAGQTLTITGVSNAVGGAVSISGSNVLFTPTADFNGTAGFDYTVMDNGTTHGSADPKSTIGHASFSITAVNDAPTASNLTQALNLAEDVGTAPKLFTAAPVVGDVDSASVTATLTLTNTAAGALNGAGTGVGGVYTIAGTPAAVSAALAAVTFAPATDFNGTASVTVAVSDGQNGPQGTNPSGTVSITVTEVNDAPVAASDTLSSVAEDSSQRTISGATLTGNDSKGPANEGAQTLTITGVSNAVGGTVSISGGNVLFTPGTDFNGTAGFDYTVTDNGTTHGSADPKSAIGHASFAVTAVNDPVHASAPATLTAAENHSAALSGLSISDVDATLAPSGVYEVSLAAGHGALTLASLAGLTFTAGDGTADAAMTFHGTLSAINTALATASYAGATAFNGTDSIAFSATDTFGGVVATGTGAATSDSHTIAITVTPGAQPPTDFDGDGFADVLWRESGGEVAIWGMNGTQIVSNQAVASPDNSWHVQGVGDFDGDHRGDVLLRNDSGQVVIWGLNGAQITSNQSVATPDNSWHVNGVGDFDGDGHSDVLWRNDSGQVVIWGMNGSQIVSNQTVATPGNDWHVQGVADFDGDGKGDVLWRNDSGQVVIWGMNGTQIATNQSVATPGREWHVKGTGDFDGDGHADVLWQNNSGQVVIWQMNSSQIVGNATVATLDASWHVQDVLDLNGDQHADVLWRNDSGQVVAWEMNGTQIIANNSIAVPGNDWIVATHHYDII